MSFGNKEKYKFKIKYKVQEVSAWMNNPDEILVEGIRKGTEGGPGMDGLG